MNKRAAAIILALGMLMNQSLGAVTAAGDGQNAYGHTVTYKPVTQLYAGGEGLKLFDAGITEWGALSDKITRDEAKSIEWLQKNNYLLNRFGRRLSGDLQGCLNSKGEWQTKITGPRKVRRWSATVSFNALDDREGRENGNISGMYDKGDIQYFFSWKVKTVQTRWGLTDKSNDIGYTFALDETVKSSGGGWKSYNTLGGGPNLGDFSAWKSGDKLGALSFIAMSDKDANVDSYLSGAMLVGRDIKGPRISSVKVTADAEGTKEIDGGVITLDKVRELKNRTVYFRVQWDEPVVFKNMPQSGIAGLALNVETIGIDGTSGIIAEAPFLKFEPSKTDGKPVMVFEYKIADPYTDASAVTQERGYFYNFSKVTVSEKENAKLWNNIYDISGNKFAADENGAQPAGKVTAIVGGASRVDLQPFGIKSIEMTKGGNESNPFFSRWEKLTVKLSMNKRFSKGARAEGAPVITLNIKNDKGEYITAAPEDGDQTSLIYRVLVYPSYKTDGSSVRVINVAPGEQSRDESGYPMMNYKDSVGMLAPTDIPPEAEGKISEYRVSPDKQYKIDFDAPVITLSANDENDGVIAVKALIDDNSAEGCDAAFTVRVHGTAKKGGILYQASASENYDDAKWISGADDTLNASFGAPIVSRNGECAAYGFIKLPDKSEADAIDITVKAADEAGNAASADKNLSAPDWAGYDKAAPEIKTTVDFEKINISISDMDDDVTYMYGFSDNDADEPAYTSASGKEAVISAPELPEDGSIHSKTAWIKASDSRGNTSETLKIPMRYDRTYTSIEYTADMQKDYLQGDYPSAKINIKNTKCYWFTWAEKPAGVADAASYIAEKYLADFKARAERIADVHTPADDDPSTEQPNNESVFGVYLTGETSVAKIDETDESYSGDIAASESSRPVMLVLAAERGDGSTLVRTVDFNTIYAAPKAAVTQNRFSTNDASGKRVDYIRGGSAAGLIWASDTDKYTQPVNTPHLFGFAQAEFLLGGDPVTGLERVDLKNSFVTFEKVVYDGENISGREINRTVIQTWMFDELRLGDSSGGGSAVADIDISGITPEYCEADEDGGMNSVRYELVSNMSYTGGLQSTKNPIAYYAFSNMPRAYLGSTCYDTGNWISHYKDIDGIGKGNTEAVFDKDGKDVTQNIPLYTISTEYPEYANYPQYIRFSPSGSSYSSSNAAYYGAPVQNITESENKAKLAVHIGTDPKNLSDVVEFEADRYGVESQPYDIGQYLFGDEKEIRSVTLYYRFEHPDRGAVSPIYVMKLRRDNTAPVFDMSVSETERMTNEVLVKLNGVYDRQTAPDGTIVTDTENPQSRFEAWRMAVKSDDLDSIPEEDLNGRWVGFDEETGENIYEDYVRVKPDADGIYHFISNGYIMMNAEDDAGNYSSEALINGERVVIKEEGMDFPCYYIENVDSEPPAFETVPTVAVNDGSFTLTAKGDETVKNVYVKFDKAYSELLSGSVSAADAAYNIKDVPGMLSGGFNAENGEITAEIYAKYSQSVPLSSVTLIIEDSAGNQSEYKYAFEVPLYGKKAEVTNARNANGYPVWSYGEALNFSVPVSLDGTDGKYALSYESVPIYADGITEIGFTDLFGESASESIYADVFGAAFAHTLKFTADGKEITPQTKVSADVTITVDTGKTKNLSVDGGKNEFTFSENGELNYSLTNSDIGETKKFRIPVTNIDKTTPEAIVSFNSESERDIETGALIIYSATYSIEGFSEDGVSLIPSADGAAPSSVTFDGSSESLEYTFRFRDEVGNEGSYTADASEIAFAQRTDNNITDYRLTYQVADDNGFRTIGRFGSNDNIDIELVNRAVSVKIEALNKNGDAVSSSVSVNGDIPDGAKVYAKEKLVMFTSESSADRTVNLTVSGNGSGNAISASVLLPANTIDLTAPTGTVNYRADGNTVKAYLVTKDSDLAENGVYVTGTKTDGKAFELKSDENGYYTELDLNGAGKFVLTDRAGNIGTVAIAVLTIDKEPPQVVSEGWQSVIDARTEEAIKELLSTPTNSTIKLFITFNEQLKGAAVKAYKDSGKNEELHPTEDYVTAVTSGTALTVEFKQNCLAMLTVYDLRDNASVLWRPEDGPISVIDRDIPKLSEGYPKRTKDGNTVKLEYVFEGGEEVMLLQNHADGYKNSHIVTVGENGTQTLNFADRAGNVFSDYPVISDIDDLAPNIKMSVDYVGSGAELSGNDSYKAGNFYTNKNVRILLNVTDETADGIAVTAKTKSGAPIAVKAERLESNGKSYNYSITVTENGSYKVTAADKWGHENSVETNVSVIDRTAPTVKLGGSIVLKAGTGKDEAIAEITKEIKATDTQSGANAPIGDKLGEVNDGVKLAVDLGNVNLEKEGAYTAIITAADRLGNAAEKKCTVVVLKDIYKFSVNGTSVYANDVFTTAPGQIRILNANKNAKYYYAQGYKTAAQMKYAKGFDASVGFGASQKGYYTILAQEEGRKMYLLYVYVN